ncbi:MAG: efflux RND transporter periplasmic adaptor subunit [Prevotellaceae bacterium]|jgi:cobalt-zinc-cadmium efflux system membrane fusion protein|nr:efflux RND transporter periplasmic adaptor subunit [Prevotellaceae bacterium]
MKQIKTITPLIFLAIITTFASCKGNEKQKTEIENADTEIIELSKQQIEAVGIELGKIEQKNLSSVVRANGQLVLTPQNQADVNSLIAGRIAEIVVTEGENVRKGQTLAYLENLEIVRLQESYFTQKQELALSRQEYERQQQLSAENAGTGKLLQQAESKYESDKVRLASLETQLRHLNISINSLNSGNVAGKIPIAAPISGVIGKIYVKTGSYADMQTVLMDITDNSQVHCDLKVFEKDLPKIKVGQIAEISLTNQGGKIITGKVQTINQSFDDESKSISVHIKIDKPEKLLPGMYVSALIQIDNQLVTAVPQDAIINAEGKKFIFALAEQDKQHFHFKKIEVITGTVELNFVEITPLETLPADAQIVTKGAFYLMSMIGEEASHEH